MQKPVIFLAFANDKVDYARYLRNLPIELDGIRKSLHEAQQAGLCEVVERANATIEQILDIFQQYRDQVAIFHYGGHADGYQLLLEQLDGSHAVAKGEGLVSFLAKQKGLKLIFFNGCSTQQQSLELLEAGVPAVVGTSNSINDEIATNLAVRFYKGIGSGANLERAWNESVDQIKIQFGTDQMKKLYRLKKDETVPDQFPWSLLIKEGAEGVKEWNLPDSVNNPLYGLPPIPQTYQLPESPFLFLKRYERQHAEVFFGRSYYIRDLYNKITDVKTPPVVLFYGQSGTGKSSLFDAGLNPRLEQSHVVLYMRRDQQKGLLETLHEGLKGLWEESKKLQKNTAENSEKPAEEGSQDEKLEKRKALVESLKQQLETLANTEKIDLKNTILTLEKELLQETSKPMWQSSTDLVYVSDQEFKTQFGENNPHFTLWRMWHDIEMFHQKPLVVTLDQVEEVFTRPNKTLSNELGLFLQGLQVLFNVMALSPHGTLILGYRKEYHAEIEERFKEYAIPRSHQFFEVLSRKEILDIFEGLSKTPNLQKRYNLKVDPNLPVIIADDLLEDKDSPVAPVLQILLTKMWDKVKIDAQPHFTVELYQNLKREGFLLDDFFYQQMAKFSQWNEEIEKSGLPLDMLFFHTTDLRTATGHHLDQIKTRYQHIPQLAEEVVNKLRELYLLVDSGENMTNLTHDTIAPLIRREYRSSERAGQRAVRLLESQMDAYEDDKTRVLDEVDLAQVEKGQNAMRAWTAEETEMVEASRRAKEKLEQERIRNRNYAIITISLIFVTAIFSLYQWTKSHKNMRRATVKELVLMSSDGVQKDVDLSIQQDAVRLAESAYQMRMSVEWKDRTKACDNFRQVCESYRKMYGVEARWDAPYREINFRNITGVRRFQQQIEQQQSNLFDDHLGKGNFGKKGENTINYEVLPDSLPPEFVNLTYKFTEDNSRLVTLIAEHSFRVDRLDVYEKPYVFRTHQGDSAIRNFMPTNGDNWYMVEKNNDINLLNIRTLEKKLIHKADSALLDYDYQLLKATEKELIYWHYAYLLRLSNEEGENWETPQIDTLVNMFSYEANLVNGSPPFSQVWISQNQEKILMKPYSSDTLWAVQRNESGKYDFKKLADPFIFANIRDISADGNHIVTIFSGKMTVFKLDWDNEWVGTEEFFGKRFLGSSNDSEFVIQFVPSAQMMLMVRLGSKNEIQFYNSAEELIDVIANENPNRHSEFNDVVFSHDGRYIATRDVNKIVLRRPANSLAGWLAKTDVPELSLDEKIAYQIATLEEELQDDSPSRDAIMLQIISFIGILVMVVRYFPKTIELFEQKRYFKLIVHGSGVLGAATLLALYNQAMGETNTRDNYAFLAIIFIPFAMLLAIFDGREKLKEYIRTRNWLKLVRKLVPELSVIAACLLIIQDSETNDIEFIYWGLLLVCLFNFFIIWLIHRASVAFEEQRYVKVMRFMALPTILVLFVLALIVTYTISQYEIYFFYIGVFYVAIWVMLWLRQVALRSERFRGYVDQIEGKLFWR